MKEKEDRGPLDLTLLVEQHAKEKWELTQQLSKAAEELTIFKGTKKLVGDMSVDLVETKKQLKEVGEELATLKKSKITIFDEEREKFKDWKEMYEKEHKLRQEAQGETTIVKGIGMNSPEMKTLKSEVEALKQQLHTDREKARARIKELDNSLAIALEINEEHQRYNGKLQMRLTDVEEDNKKLAHQVEDIKMNQVRKAGL